MILSGDRGTSEGDLIAERVEQFVRNKVIPFERDKRWQAHGPDESLVLELRELARAEGLMTPHVRKDGSHLKHVDVARVLTAAGLSPLGPTALNVMAPDEGNMYLLAKVATSLQQEIYLAPLLAGVERSAFLMTEPASDGGAGSDPMMLKTTATPVHGGWQISGRKAFITGAEGASTAIIMARTGESATMFLARLPNPAIYIERVLDTLDSSMPGGHAIVVIDNLLVSAKDVLGEVDEGLRYAQVRLAPARLTHCMRWLGGCIRANEIAANYAVNRHAFGQPLIDHEGVGFMLAENEIDLKQAELMIQWCAAKLDTGTSGTVESSMAKASVSESLFRVADRCVQVMGGTGVSGDTVVEQIFREVRAFRIYDGPTEVHKWSLAKRIKKAVAKNQAVPT